MSSNDKLIYSLSGCETILNLNCKLIFCIINIIFNSLIIRNINLNIIGLANIRLELIYSTLLFFSRDVLRRNISKINNIHLIYHYINLIWLIIPLGFIFVLFSFFIISFIKTNNDQILIPYYNQACFMYGLAAFIELLSEPFYLLARITRHHSINIYIEFISSIIAFSIQTILIINNHESALFYYGFGYIIYSILKSKMYYIYFLINKKEDRHRLFLISSLNELLIKPTSPFVDDKILNETFKCYQQEISMKILTEGEKYLITIFYLISYEEQAIFYIIYLLKSIFIHFIFPTIEQTASNYFQQTLSIIKKDNNQQLPTPTERTIKLNVLTLLNNLVRLLILISLLLIIFLIPHSSLIINIFIGSKYKINSRLVFYLQLYLINILLNSINIINESFVQLIILKKQFNNYKIFLLFYSFIYLFLSYLFIYLFDIYGIIIINSLNIIGRIIINNYLINKYLIQIQWIKFYLFSSHYIFTLIITLIMFNFNQYFIQDTFGQIIFFIGLTLTTICLTFIEEKQMIHYIYCVCKLHYQNQKCQLLKKQ